MRIHGNYCGPNWSNGRHQPSVVGDMPPIDEFDETCRVHDAQYALGNDLAAADATFAWSNLGKGFLPTVAAMVVGAQGALRAADKYRPKFIKEKKTEMTPRLRGTPRKALNGSQNKNKKNEKVVQATQKTQTRKTPGFEISTAFPSTSIGTMIRASKPNVTRSTEAARMQGRDFIGTVECNGVATFGLGKSALLSPAYFASTVLGNLARSFEKYTWLRLRIHYVPKVATTATGQVIMCSQRSASEPVLQPEAGTFLPRAMSQGNACFTPLWQPAFIDIDCNGEYKLVDPATTSDIDDCIHEELQVFTQAGVQGQVGYLFAEYDIAFREPIYQPHSTAIPLATGPGIRATVADNALPAVGDAVTWTVAGLPASAVGHIYRMVVDLPGSAAPVGTSFANLWGSNTFSHTNLTTFSNDTTQTLPIVGGLTIYGVYNPSGVLRLYTSLEAAVNGSGTGQIFYRQASLGVGSYNLDAATVRIGVISLPTVQ